MSTYQNSPFSGILSRSRRWKNRRLFFQPCIKSDLQMAFLWILIFWSVEIIYWPWSWAKLFSLSTNLLLINAKMAILEVHGVALLWQSISMEILIGIEWIAGGHSVAATPKTCRGMSQGRLDRCAMWWNWYIGVWMGFIRSIWSNNIGSFLGWRYGIRLFNYGID